jgi:hypothetical protein
MKPRAVLVRVRRTVKEHDFALIPTLVRLADVSEIERGETVWRIRGHSTHAALVALTAVCRVAVVPDVDWYLQSLKQIQPKDNVKIALRTDGGATPRGESPFASSHSETHSLPGPKHAHTHASPRDLFVFVKDRKVWGRLV